MRIEKVVESLCRRYGTRDPYEIASCRGVNIVRLPLGGIKGYYSKCFRQRIIHINSDFSLEDQRFTCAHELGHAILHPNSNTPFLRAGTFYSIGRFEKEANCFAVDLLYSDEDLREFYQFSIVQIAECLNLPIQLVEYRLSIMERQLKFPV